MYGMIYKLFIIVLLFSINIHSQTKDLILEDLIKQAIDKSPEISMLKAKLAVVSSRIDQGTNLPDPQINVGLVNMPINSFSFTQEPMTGKIIGVSQSIPFPGGLSKAAEAKANDTLIVNEEIKGLINSLRRSVSQLYYDLILVREEIKLNKDRVRILNQLREIAKQKYEVSNISLQNIFMLEVRLTDVNVQIELLESKEKSILVELNSLLLKDPGSPIITSYEDYKYEFSSEFKDLFALVLKYQPVLQTISLAEKGARLKEEESEYKAYPNFNIALQYTQRDYSKLSGADYHDLVSVIAGISLPINYGGKISSAVNENRYLQKYYQEKLKSKQLELKKEFDLILVKLSELHKRREILSDTLISQSESAFDAALSEYKVSKIEISEVLRSEEGIIDAKLSLRKTENEFLRKISDLEFLIGTDIKSALNQKEVIIK
jgi:outer membrane protein TolC